ncbi:MAG: A/G-specific adenine glycosylase [Streptococcus sp.]|nr:A/G-specific adenine glycosylase [Streptococcus sp.]
MDLAGIGVKMWDKKKIERFRKTLLDWYDKEKRDLPWRRTTDPYAIWVSEIMLQQTRVDTVIPYYERFLATFPTVKDLAEAPEELLLKCWEGLGYYSRVRNMQKAAIQIMEEFGGVFPNTYEGILSLKGIGPYTAGAIASIAFGLPEPAVDGNLMRVISRLFEVNLDIGNPSNRWAFQEIAEILIDPNRPGDFNQALMDLGSDIESPVNPRPEESPVKEFSAAYQNGTMHIYPIKKPKKKPTPMKWRAFVIQDEKGRLLVEKNTQADLLSGFWHFPLIRDFSTVGESIDLFEGVAEENSTYDINQNIPLEVQFESLYKMKLQPTRILPKTVKHIFSHQRWDIELQCATASGALEQHATRTLQWVTKEEMAQLPQSRVQGKMCELLASQELL